MQRFIANRIRRFVRWLLGRPLEFIVVVYYSVRSVNSEGLAPQHQRRSTHTVSEPIDVVYTWVNDADPEWRHQKVQYQEKFVSNDGAHPAALHSTRFHDRDELRYSLRSLERYASFVNSVYLVTNGQVPEWLNTTHPKLKLVAHQEIFSDPAALPTFNSHAIESQLHHIDGLAEHYLYLNDDVFFAQAASPQDFFTSDGKAIAYLDEALVSETIVDPVRDSSLEWAAKNNARLLRSLGNTQPLHKLLHVPHSQQKSVLIDLEDRFPAEFGQVAASRFRHSSDFAIATSLQQHYGMLSGKVELRGPHDPNFRACYVNVASPFLRPILKRIRLSARYKAFCINEPVSADIDTSQFDCSVKAFLNSCFPQKSAFEK